MNWSQRKKINTKKAFKVGDIVQVKRSYSDSHSELAGLAGKIVITDGANSFGLDFGMEQACKLDGYPRNLHGLWKLGNLSEDTGRYFLTEDITKFNPNHDGEE
jgi:hypothetical protein